MGKSLLLPGFSFHPTDDVLVVCYLKKKLLGIKLDPQVIAEVKLYDFEPWDLPDKSILSGDREWYFFCPTLKKYLSGPRKNRITKAGYWKGTGKDKPVIHKGKTVGMRKTLIFYLSHEPKGTRTNWVMHEFRMTDDDLFKQGVSKDAYVVCRVFEKNDIGPNNGAQYGAPFEEKDWDDDDDEKSTITSLMMVGVLVNPNNVSTSSVMNMTSTEAGPSTVTSLTVVDPNASTSGPSTQIHCEKERLTDVHDNNNTEEIEDRKGKKLMTDPVDENDVHVNDDDMLTNADFALLFRDYGPKEVEDPKGKKGMTVPVKEKDVTFEELMGLSDNDLGQDDSKMFNIDEFSDERLIDDEFAADRMNDDEFQKYMEMFSGLI